MNSLANNSLGFNLNLVMDNSMYIKILLKNLKKNPNWIEDNLIGDIESDTLLKFLRASCRRRKYRIIMPDVIELANASAFNEEVFDFVLHYPEKTLRDELLISLCHKKLKEDQLIVLCEQEISFECYFELAILYYSNTKYQIEDLMRVITTFHNSKYSYMKKELLMDIWSNYIASSPEKDKYIIGLLKDMCSGELTYYNPVDGSVKYFV